MTSNFVVEKSLRTAILFIHDISGFPYTLTTYVSPTNSSPGLTGLPLEFTRYMKTHSDTKVVCPHDLGELLEPTGTNSMNSIQAPSDPNKVLLIVTGITGITALQLRT